MCFNDSLCVTVGVRLWYKFDFRESVGGCSHISVTVGLETLQKMSEQKEIVALKVIMVVLD